MVKYIIGKIQLCEKLTVLMQQETGTKGLLKIRDCIKSGDTAQVEDATDEEIQRAQRKLGIEYICFQKDMD